MVLIPARRESAAVRDYELGKLMGRPIAPLGSLFEISAMVFFETCVVQLMDLLGVNEESMMEVHANL